MLQSAKERDVAEREIARELHRKEKEEEKRVKCCLLRDK